jgi:hypothetical protein
MHENSGYRLVVHVHHLAGELEIGRLKFHGLELDADGLDLGLA